MESSNVDDKNTTDKDTEDVTQEGLEDISEEEEEGEEEGEEDGDDDEDDWESDEEGDEGDDDVGSDEGNDDDEDDDDDEEDDEEEEEEAVLEASDSDAEDTERCPICLDRFRDQDVGTPESCDHTFCLECITEWSKNVNTCPADRRVFRLILCKHGLDDPIYKKIPVEDINLQQEEEEEEDDPVYCEVCHLSNHEDRLLLCDGCDEGYHLECLTPPLTQVPVEEWFCPRCARREVHDPDFVHTASSHHRRIARTLVSERVRSAIEEIRVRRARSIRRLVSSDEEEEADSSSVAAATTAEDSSSSSPTKKVPVRKTPVRRKTSRKYKKRRKTKRKTRKRKTTKKTAGTTPKGKKRKRKGGRRRKKRKTPKKLARTAKPMPVTTPKTRIADALGLSKPPPGRTIPMQKLKQEKTQDMKRGDIGADSLSIFGSKDELIHFEDDQAEDQPSGSSAGTSKYSRLSLSSYKPIGRVPVLPTVREKKRIVIKTEPAAASGDALDLLSSIMQCQDRLNMSSKDVTIHRDGSLTTKPIESQQSRPASKSSTISPGSSLFKSSFTAVDKSVDKPASVLTSLSTTEKGRSQSPEKLVELNEEYDPANPTEDLDENMGKSEDNINESEDVYDPAHPTDDLSSEEETLISDKKEITAATVEHIKDEHVLHDNKSELEKTKTDKFKLDQRSTKIEFSFKTGINIGKNKKKTPEKEEIKIKVENGKVNETEKKKEKSITEDKTAAVNKSNITSSSVKTSLENPDSSKKVQINVQKTPEKVPVPGSSEKESLLKKSPSVKITETSKKSASVVKPFEISRKTLFEKKRLYGGEIDFSEDVDFSEGAFPETFEINAKRIEEVFKGTLKKPEPKLVEPETKVLDKPQVLSKENTCTLNVVLNKDNKVVNCEPNSIETVKPNEEIIDKSKPIAKAAEKEKSVKETIERNKEEIGSDKLVKEKVHIEPKDKDKEMSDNTKENISRSEDKSKEKLKVQKTNDDDKSKGKSIKENKDKIKITVEKSKSKPDENDEYTGMTKLSVSDRFKKIKSDKKTQDAGHLEEEDPIHEMRKLDKALELEFGKTAFSKKKDKDTKKTKRKVSLDDLEKENLRIRRDSKESKEKRKLDSSRHSQDDREEGEVDDDIRLKDKKKKDKKRRKSEKDLYYGDDYLEPGESDIDRRIVIQVSQNNEDRTVWEEAERQRRKREDRKKEKERHKDSDKDTKKEKKLKRQKSRSRSHEKRIRSRSRDRRRSKSWSRERDRSRHRDRSRDRSRSKDRDKSRERARRKRKERVRSQSRDRSVERSRKKKKRNRSSRDRDREVSKGWSPSRSKDRDWSRERDLSMERSRDQSQGRTRDRKRSREHSGERVDIFGRSKSPYIRKEHIKEKKNLTPRKKPKKERFDPDEVIILDSPPPPKEPKYEEVSSSESEKDSPETARNIENMDTFSQPKSKDRIETVSRIESKGRVEAIARIESIDRRPRDSSPELANDKDEEDDDEPEETEQFQYTDREEFLGQNTSKQMRQNLITIGVNHSDLAKNSVPTPPPLPEPLNTPTPPLPPTVGDFNHFPPPPPGPPPQGPPPGTVIIQERPLHIQGPPGQNILGEGPILIQGPPPLESGPPPDFIQQRPVPVNINVLPPGFHRGLPPTITSQRQVLVSPIRQTAPRLQRLASPGGVRLGWQVNTTEIIPGQFGPGVASPGHLVPGHPVINGPFEGLPPPHSESLPPHSLPPGHLNFPPPSLAPGEPASHVIAIKTNTPPPNIVQIPVEVNEANRYLPPVGPESQHLHIGPDPRIPPPRLPIPLLPTVSEPPPMSIMVSMPPPSSGMMSMPPPGSVQEPFPRTGTPPNSVSAIIGLARLGAGSMPSVTSSLIPGLQMATSSAGISTGEMSNVSTSQSTLSELEKISELLNTQAHLMNVAKEIKQSGTAGKMKGDTLFKVPLAPAGKMGSKNGVDATEVVDMEIGSPINEEGNIELPVSPQFDNLIDNPEDLLEEDFNKKMKELLEKAKSALSNNEEQKVVTPTKNKKVKEVKDQDMKKDSPQKPKEEKHKRLSKENKHGHHHKHRKHRTKPDAEKDLKEKALKDAHLDLETQEVPSSAVDMTNKEKYLKKLHLQERVVEEVKMAIKPFYSNKEITKEQYKEVLRKAVPKICHSKSGNINPMKIKNLVEAYVEKYKKHSNHNHTPNKQQDISPGFDDIIGLTTTKTAR